MKSQLSQMLLAANDPTPVLVINPQGRSPFLLIGDHAGNRIPPALEPFGVRPEDMRRHIAWDIGIADLGEALSAALDAVFIRQVYSRLVIDCNRDPARPDAMPASSDGTVVPGNQMLTAADRRARVAEIQEPYQNAIAAEIVRRDAVAQPTVLVSLHSFTPSMHGVDRPWHIGLLYSGGDTQFAHALLEGLKAADGLCVGDNQPYAMDGIDYTVPLHAFAARRSYVEIELRQDLLSKVPDILAWATTLAGFLPQALSSLGSDVLPTSRDR